MRLSVILEPNIFFPYCSLHCLVILAAITCWKFAIDWDHWLTKTYQTMYEVFNRCWVRDASPSCAAKKVCTVKDWIQTSFMVNYFFFKPKTWFASSTTSGTSFDKISNHVTYQRILPPNLVQVTNVLKDWTWRFTNSCCNRPQFLYFLAGSWQGV